jgi:hypothetical protein
MASDSVSSPVSLGLARATLYPFGTHPTVGMLRPPPELSLYMPARYLFQYGYTPAP